MPSRGGDLAIARLLARTHAKRVPFSSNALFSSNVLSLATYKDQLHGPQLLVEPYEVTESRIQQVIDILSDCGKDNPNIWCRGLKPVCRLILGFFKAKCTVVGVAYSLRA